MAVQAHRINIEANQESVFEALSTADGGSSWFTPTRPAISRLVQRSSADSIAVQRFA